MMDSQNPPQGRVVYGRLNSVNVQKVIFTCELLSIPYTRIDAGMAFGVNNTDEYKANNPTGLIPTLVEADGFSVWESHAIVRFLFAEHSKTQRSTRDIANADKWMDWTQSTLAEPMKNVFWQLIRFPTQAPEKCNQAILDTNVQLCKTAYALYARHIKGKFLLGM